VQPRNHLLFACHFTNATAQFVQNARFINYWHFGGRERNVGVKAENAVGELAKEGQDAVKTVGEKVAAKS
jgi:hypothetical protein